MQPKISIIIPVYNVEKYIRECLDSILCQTFSDFEVLLIDDGSPDKSGDICDEYATKDPRFRVFHKPNGGVSSARNLGLENAQGEWVLFVDADDWITPDYIASLYQSIIENKDIKLVHGGCLNYIEGRISINQEYSDYISDDPLYLLNNFRGLIVSKLFKLEIIKRHSIRFDIEMKIAEDYAFTLDYIQHINLYAFSSAKGYFYRHHNTSSTKKLAIRPYDTARIEFLHQYNSLTKYYSSKNIDAKNLTYRFEQMGNSLYETIMLLYRNNYDNRMIEKAITKDFKPEHLQLLNYVKIYKHKLIILMIKIRAHFIIKAIIKQKKYLRVIVK